MKTKSLLLTVFLITLTGARYRQPATLRTAVFLCGPRWTAADARPCCTSLPHGAASNGTNPC